MADLEKQIELLRVENALQHEETIGSILNQENAAEEQVELLRDLVDEIVGQREDSKFDREEARRDAQKKAPKAEAPAKKKEKSEFEIDFGLSGILQTLAGIGAAVAGFATGLVQGFGRILNLVTKRFLAPFRAIADVFKKRGTGQFLKGDSYKALGRTTAFFRRIADTFARLEKATANALKPVGNLFRTIRSYAGMIGNSIKGISGVAIDKITKPFKDFGKFLGGIQRAVVGLPSPKEGAAITGLIDKITKPFKNFIAGVRGAAESTSKFGKALGSFFNAFKVVGRFIAFPLTIIMGIIDGFKGLMAGADRQAGTFNKLIGGAVGAITGVLKGLVAMPLDLLKSAVSWIAEKIFGKDNFLTKFLDSFKFTDMFQMVGDNIADIFVDFFDGVIYVFSDLKQRLMKPFKDGFSFGAVLELLTSLPGTIIGGVLDLGKNLLSSVLSVFGFEEEANALDSFNFTNLIDNIIENIGGFFLGTFGDLKTNLMNIFDSDSDRPLLERIFAFVRDLVTSIYTFPLDLIKGVASTILSFFGMNEQSDFLESFSFKDTFGKIIDWVIALPGKLVDGLMGILSGEIDIGQVISDAMSGAMDMASQFNEYLKSIAQPYLSALAQDDSWLGSIGNFLVPKPAFEWAGVDPDTGEISAPAVSAPETTTRTQAGEAVTEQSKENAQAQGGGGVAMVDASQRSNTTVNNNQQTAAIIDQNLPTQDQNDRSWAWA
jgi:hypothetical protein